MVDFAVDCRENTLPTVSLIDPSFLLADDHPSHDVTLGQKFIGLIVDALSHSESWESTALVLMYDENGGFYDHVSPSPVPGNLPPEDNRLGFRVPLVVISPFARRGQASHQIYDHTSIMKSISTRWQINFPNEFGTRWSGANDIWDDCFDFSQTPAMGTYTGIIPAFSNLNWTSGVHDLLTGPEHDLARVLERAFILPGLKTLDRRSEVFDILNKFEQEVVTLKKITDGMT